MFVREAVHAAVEAYSKQSAGDARPLVKAFLASISSKSERKGPGDKPPPLTADETRLLTDADVESMAIAYLGKMNNLHYIAKAKKAKPPIQRDDTESAVAFLDQLLRWRAEDYKHSIANLGRKFLGGDALDKLTGHSRVLKDIAAAQRVVDEADRTRKLMDQAFGSETLRSFKKLQDDASGVSKMIDDIRRQQDLSDHLRRSTVFPEFPNTAPGPPIFEPPPRLRTIDDGLRDMADEINQAADRREEQRQSEREEELKINRSISEMTMKSSELLAQLTRASSTMLEKFAVFLIDFKASAERSDAGARRNLRWAAWSLGITAALTLVGAFISGASYNQDKANNASGDKWQSQVPEILMSQASASEKARQDLAIENGQLRQRIEMLEKYVAKRDAKKEAKEK